MSAYSIVYSADCQCVKTSCFLLYLYYVYTVLVTQLLTPFVKVWRQYGRRPTSISLYKFFNKRNLSWVFLCAAPGISLNLHFVMPDNLKHVYERQINKWFPSQVLLVKITGPLPREMGDESDRNVQDHVKQYINFITAYSKKKTCS